MSGMISGFEEVTKAMTERLLHMNEVLMDQIGPRKYGETHVPEGQQVQNYMLVRDNPDAWAAIIAEHGANEARDYMLRLEKMLPRYPDDAAFGAAAAKAQPAVSTIKPTPAPVHPQLTEQEA